MATDQQIDEWLEGHELDTDQRERFVRLFAAYEEAVSERPGPRADYIDDDLAAVTAVIEIVTGRFDLEERGRQYLVAKRAAYIGAMLASLDGMSEVRASSLAAITRPKLRKALGK